MEFLLTPELLLDAGFVLVSILLACRVVHNKRKERRLRLEAALNEFLYTENRPHYFLVYRRDGR